MLVEERGGTEEQCWLNSVVEQWNSGTVMDEQCGGTLIVET